MDPASGGRVAGPGGLRAGDGRVQAGRALFFFRVARARKTPRERSSASPLAAAPRARVGLASPGAPGTCPHRWACPPGGRAGVGEKVCQAPGPKEKAARRRGIDARPAFFFLHFFLPVGRHNHARPVERVAARIVLDAIQRQLRAHQEDEERDGGVERPLAEGNAAVRTLGRGGGGERKG